MDVKPLGSTGLRTSEIALGCTSFGDPEWRDIGWILGEEESRALIERAVELGINYFDTANRYSFGASERILGDVIAEYDRERFVIGTKVFTQMDPDNPNSGGLSRKAIEQEVEHSLDRLGMDTVDIYQIHRWDDRTPIETTLRTLDDLVRRGQVREVGATTLWARQLFAALRTSERLGLERFGVMQSLYNLAYREGERELFPFCASEGVAVTPWSPLAGGFLARPHEELEATARGERMSDLEASRLDRFLAAGGETINERVEELATDHGISMAQLSLAWLLHKDWVDVPIVGATKVKHLEEAVEATEVSLSRSDLRYLEEPYRPVEPIEGPEDPDPR
jgi:aryl-alcohol dehydrogenase-like predicted oxidoreductase